MYSALLFPVFVVFVLAILVIAGISLNRFHQQDEEQVSRDSRVVDIEIGDLADVLSSTEIAGAYQAFLTHIQEHHQVERFVTGCVCFRRKSNASFEAILA